MNRSMMNVFRAIAESFECKPRYAAASYFCVFAKNLYPSNLSRREWAEANMMMFYDNKQEEIQIMLKLSSRAIDSYVRYINVYANMDSGFEDILCTDGQLFHNEIAATDASVLNRTMHDMYVNTIPVTITYS